MSSASDIIAQLLTNLANDNRRTVSTYVNVTARPGTSVIPRRLMSDIGFLESPQFTYVNASPTNYHIDDTEGQRKIDKIVIVPVGLSFDRQRLTAATPSSRVMGNAGVKPYPTDTSLVMPGYFDPVTHVPAKSQIVMRGMTTRQGPAYHYYLDRLGATVVGPTVDAVVAPINDNKETSIFIAVEMGLVMSAADHAARVFNKLIPLPFTELQLFTLGILIDKLRIALPDILVEYSQPDLDGVLKLNFSSEAWKTADVPFSYAATDQPAFNTFVANQGVFDLSTEVWRVPTAPAPVASRSAARTAISQVNTMGEVSPLLGAYATIAASERSNAMQVLARRQMFVARQRTANMDADTATEGAAVVTEAGDAMVDLQTPPVAYEVNTYDFKTGLWGDNKAY